MTPADPIPASVTGRFDELAPAGSGASGVVYRAVDRELGRPVAVKVLDPRLRDDARAAARFRREALVVAKLSHPNLVRIYDVDRSPRPAWIALEWVDGESLDAVLARGGCSTDDLIGWIVRAALAVQAAHEAGVVHRDLKPSNVRIDSRGEPRVLDFGLVHLVGGTSIRTDPKAVLGTPLYMAPEQAAGDEEISARADVFALGAILYRGLTGRPPHSLDDPSRLLERIRTCDPPRPRRLDPRIDPALERIVLRALERDPRRRYASARDLAETLETFRSGRPRRPLRRVVPRRAWIGIAIAAAAAGLGLGSNAFRRPAEPRDGRPAEALLLVQRAQPALAEAERRILDPHATAEDYHAALDAAEALLERALAAAPGEAAAHFLLGRCRELRGGFEDAEVAHERALGSNDRFLPAHVARARVRFVRMRLDMLGARFDGLPEGELEAMERSYRRRLASLVGDLAPQAAALEPVDRAFLDALAALDARDPESARERLETATGAHRGAEGVEYLEWLLAVLSPSPTDALVHLDAALAQVPHHGLLRFWRGSLRLELGDASGAVEDLDDAVRFLPSFLPARFNRGQARASAGDRTGAIADLDAVLRLDPGSALAHAMRSQERRRMGDHAGALADAEAAMRIDPRAFSSRTARARALMAAGDAAAAFPELDALLEERPDQIALRLERVDARVALGDVARASDELDDVIRRTGPEIDTIDTRVEVRLRLEAWSEALEDLDYLAGRRTDASDLARRAVAESALGRQDRAIEAADRALAIDPRSTRALHARGIARRRRGDADLGLPEFEACVRIDETSPTAWLALGTTLRDLQRHAEAIEPLGRFLQLEPGHLGALKARGMCRLHVADLEGGIADLDAVLAVERTDFTLWFYRGQARLRSGDAAGAVADLERSLELCPAGNVDRPAIEGLLERARQGNR